ncbi:MAG: hypothetical protein AB7G04_08390 [Hyphomonadaceae bacterium]
MPATLPYDETPVSTMATYNQLVTERYVYEDYKRPIVMVGSSILTNIPPAPCRPRNVASIYLQGSGAQTGLEAILRSGAKPEVVFVETAVAFLGPDENILRPSFQGAARVKALFPALRAYRNWLVMLFRSNIKRLPKSFDLPDISVDEWKRQNADSWAVHSMPIDNDASFVAGFATLQKQIQTLRARGVRVIFYDPTSTKLSDLPQVAGWRNKVKAAFPDIQWVPAPTHLQLYHRDGLHIEAFSGIQYFDHMMQWAGLDARATCTVQPSPAVMARLAPPDVALGAVIPLAGDAGRRFLLSGWWQEEDTGRWSRGDTSELAFTTPDYANAMRVILRVRAHVSPAHPVQRIEIWRDNVRKHALELANATEADVDLGVTLPPGRHPVVLELRHPDSISPLQLSGGGDVRDLAIYVSALTVQPANAPSQAQAN